MFLHYIQNQPLIAHKPISWSWFCLYLIQAPSFSDILLRWLDSRICSPNVRNYSPEMKDISLNMFFLQDPPKDLNWSIQMPSRAVLIHLFLFFLFLYCCCQDSLFSGVFIKGSFCLSYLKPKEFKLEDQCGPWGQSLGDAHYLCSKFCNSQRQMREGEENQESRNIRTIEAMGLFPPGFLSQTCPDIFAQFGRIIQKEYPISNYVLYFLEFARESSPQNHLRIQTVWAHLIVSTLIIAHKMLWLFKSFIHYLIVSHTSRTALLSDASMYSQW